MSPVGLDSWEQAVLKKWKSMKCLDDYIQEAMGRINEFCFHGELSLPEVSLGRMRFAKNWEGGYFGGRYYPPNGDQIARIKIFPFLLLEEKDIVSVLGHEMVHHWEHLQPQGPKRKPYPVRIDEIILHRFSDNRQKKRWLTTHSPRFLAKSWEVSRSLWLPIKDMLFR